jgi:C1A family cysteine protease
MHHKPVRTFSVKVLLCTLVFLVLVQGVLAAGASVGESHAAPLNPEFIRYMEERTNTSSVQADSPHLSLMNSSLSEATDSSIFPVGSRSLGSIPSPIYHPELSDVQMSVSPAGYRTSGYPASFDLRTCGKVSPVKDQTYFCTCWAFASLESTLMPAATLDFSEKNLANLAGFDGDIPNGGGNMLMSTAYLTR